MIDQAGTDTRSFAIINPAKLNNLESNAGPSTKKQEFEFFGKNGFTFFDFLDVINPLQHIPIVSVIYRSITGDVIDPGSKIAGGTLFGGPLGAALSSLDVAVKHNTGRDISDHTVAFFTDPEKNPTAPASTAIDSPGDAVGPNQMNNHFKKAQTSSSLLQTVEKGQTPLSIDLSELQKATPRLAENKFQTAGISAIPIADRPFLDKKNNATLNHWTPQDRTMLRDVTGPTRHDMIEAPKYIAEPELTPQHIDKKGTASKGNDGAFGKPYRLKPKFSVELLSVTESDRLKPKFAFYTRQTPSSEIGLAQTIADTKTDWIVGAMRRGLDKYQSAKDLQTYPSRAPAASVRR